MRRLLPGWGLPEDAALRLLAVSENATFLAEAPEGRRIVLRVHRPGYHQDREILSELAWIGALRRARVVDTPEPLRRRDGTWLASTGEGEGRRRVSAFAFQPGREPAASADLVPLFHTLGSLSARLHAHAKEWTPPPGFARKRWDVPAMLGSRPLWGDWREGVDGAGREVVARAADLVERRLLAHGTGAERFGLVHADLRLANLLIDGASLAVIDFDDCGFGWFGYDFAAAVSFIEDAPAIPALQAAWLAGYRAIAAVPPADEAALPVFVMLRRILLTAWIASRRGSPAADAMAPGFADGTVRLAERFLVRPGMPGD